MNFEIRGGLGRNPCGLMDSDNRSLRSFTDDTLLEAAQIVGRALNFNDESRRRVQHPSGKGHFSRKPVDERAEADALHGSAKSDAEALVRRVGNNRHHCNGRTPLKRDLNSTISPYTSWRKIAMSLIKVNEC